MLLCYQWTLYSDNYLIWTLLYFPLITSIPEDIPTMKRFYHYYHPQITDIIKVGILLEIVNWILLYEE